MESMIRPGAIPIDEACRELLDPEARTVFDGGEVDARAWCVAAGRVLRAWVAPPEVSTALRAELPVLRPALGAVQLELERTLRALGAWVDALAVRFEGHGGDGGEAYGEGVWSLPAFRDDVESMLVCLEALDARCPQGHDAASWDTLRHAQLELEPIDAWGDRWENELALALRAVPDTEGLRARFEAMSLEESAWWLHAALAAREVPAMATRDWSTRAEHAAIRERPSETMEGRDRAQRGRQRLFQPVASASAQRVAIGVLLGRGDVALNVSMKHDGLDGTVYGLPSDADVSAWRLRWMLGDGAVEEAPLARSRRGLVKVAPAKTLLEAVTVSLVTPDGAIELTPSGEPLP